ncbi:PREDICTED: odorant receptor 22c-like [Habropoda laboriosa]|uniref:odorant receptor 22c-like n=1 Tax=Habropoda laboriosa TaxID=597456 RepID=UPI00083DEB19|nr:PREDICTED: odorant receptor 22c-like [Habropoda laboriosa]
MKSTEENSGEKIAREFLVQETVLRIIGIWPSSVNNFASIGRWTFAILTHISTIYSLSLEVYRHCLDLDDTMDAFVMDLSSVISLSKLLVLRMKSKHTYALVDSIVKDWTNVDHSRHERIMTEYFNKGRIVSLTILYLGYASGLSFVLKALPLHLLPFQKLHSWANSTVNTNDTARLNYFLATHCVFGPLPLQHHVCVLLLQGMHIFFNAVAHCGNDGLFFSLTMHLCGQFEILKMNLAEIEFEAIACRKRIGVLVKRHCKLAVLTNDLEQSFSMIILVQLMMSALLICVEGFVFLVALSTKDNVAALRSFVLMVTLLIQLYLYAYAGNTLESRTEEIAQAAYDSLWYRCHGHAARDLLLIIHRGNSPYRITAGKFVPMNLFTFKEILKASGSYLSVMKVMMDA